MIEAIAPEAELIALAEQVHLAEKAFHDALARRNGAHIAYLREPSATARETLDAAKAAEVKFSTPWFASWPKPAPPQSLALN